MYDSAKSLLQELENMKNYFDFLDPKLNPSSTPRMHPFVDYTAPTARGMKIVVKDLKFSYPSTAKPVLNGLSFTVEPGELIAIVGGNGSGKSTLVKLLARMFDATSGSIEINDYNIRQYDKDELWSKMSVVNQDFGTAPPPLTLTIGKYYNLSVGDNIGIGSIDSLKDPLALSTAADVGGSLEFITNFPEAFETVMYDKYYRNPRASNRKTHTDLSGGQWQRLALSRAFMRLESADLLLLDEPSASLDPEAEYKLFKGLKDARKKTTIYISHRFNTVRAATKILVCQDGDAEANLGH
jgi:ATP-binding cassette subfamily B protein